MQKDKDGKGWNLSIDKPEQVTRIGHSPDMAFCRGMRTVSGQLGACLAVPKGCLCAAYKTDTVLLALLNTDCDQDTTHMDCQRDLWLHVFDVSTTTCDSSHDSA